MVSTSPESVTQVDGEFNSSVDRPPKIEGWLFFPAVGLVLSPIAFVVSIVGEVRGGFLQEIAETELAYPGFRTAIVVDTSLRFLIFVFCAFVAFRFFKGHATTPRLMIMLSLAALSLEILSCVWLTSIYKELDAEGVLATTRATLSSAIWVPYFLFSKRVKATFSRGEKRHNSNAA